MKICKPFKLPLAAIAIASCEDTYEQVAFERGKKVSVCSQIYLCRRRDWQKSLISANDGPPVMKISCNEDISREVCRGRKGLGNIHWMK